MTKTLRARYTLELKQEAVRLACGIPVGKQRVQKRMQLHGIRAKGKRRFKVTTDSCQQVAGFA